ncbi:hypothetical protein [Nitrosarchaeum koreense]|uniref:Uncharacterized protein n=1 Tax=Nitrosarchaeum koreense MY1 TaxID=1001994 RepID=F9CUL4_9ARCH|nr:hypothetical protein [Nitrosarchaeum koreense]EGP93060.1 hypothetical protein MY1_0288 [Nitrosarchaeum koreense MY1]
MQRTGIFFVIVGGIVCTGIILSFYGNQVIFEDLIKGEGQIKVGESLTIPAELDNETQNGIYAIQIMDSKGIKAKILDPFDVEIESQSINEEDFEGQFKITTSGTYKLVIENTNDKEIKIFGVIGPEPDAGKKSLGFISLYVLIVGLIGMIIVPMYAIKNRKRSFS